jgi:LysM repeat protein
VLSALALATVLYTVKPGDTLSGIAQNYNTTWEAVYHSNQAEIKNPNLVYVGEQLRVPQGDLTTSLVPVQSAAPASASVHSAPVQRHTVTTTAPASAAAHTSYAATQSTSRSTSSVSSGSGSGGLSDIPGVPQSYAACVAYRESTNNTNPAAHGNAYGIIPASGYNFAGDSIAQQKQVFKEIYDSVGPRAWAADGC